MPRRKNDCELDLTNQILSWKNIQGYVITRKFFTKELLQLFYASLDG